MKQITLILILSLSVILNAQNEVSDINNEKFSIENKIDSITQIVTDLKKDIVILKNSNEDHKRQISQLRKSYNSQIDSTDVLRNSIRVNSAAISSNAKDLNKNTENLKQRITETDEKTDNHTNLINQTIKNRTLWISIIAGLAIVLSVILAIVLYRKSINSTEKKIDKLKELTNKLNEEIVGKLSSEIEEIQKLTSAITANTQTSPDNPIIDHSLIKTIADRITFMEMTLYKMDKTIKGYKQLSKSIKQMKDNLLANGYELVDMLGKPYHDGMKVIPNFINDETLQKGEQIISGIIKPQINYSGEMIQSAQITVSQN
ncbi:MAG: hypothetical protein R3Y59_03390 [bacterium]